MVCGDTLVTDRSTEHAGNMSVNSGSYCPLVLGQTHRGHSAEGLCVFVSRWDSHSGRTKQQTLLKPGPGLTSQTLTPVAGTCVQQWAFLWETRAGLNWSRDTWTKAEFIQDSSLASVWSGPTVVYWHCSQKKRAQQDGPRDRGQSKSWLVHPSAVFLINDWSFMIKLTPVSSPNQLQTNDNFIKPINEEMFCVLFQ